MDALLGAVRLLQYGCGLTTYGLTLVRGPRALSRRWLLIAAILGTLSSLAWLSITAESLTGQWSAVADVISGTRIGKVIMLRTLLFAGMPLLLLLASPWRWKLLAGISAAVTASFTWSGHGAAGDDTSGMLHQAADVLHLLAAAVWIGALVDLCGQVRHSLRATQAAPARALLAALSRFSSLGPGIVATLVLTGVINSWVLIGPRHWTALFTTPYGLALLVKLGLFSGMLGLAAINRLRLTPRLHAALEEQTGTDAALKSLRRSLVAETSLGLLVLAAVAWLGTLVPPADG